MKYKNVSEKEIEQLISCCIGVNDIIKNRNMLCSFLEHLDSIDMTEAQVSSEMVSAKEVKSVVKILNLFLEASISAVINSSAPVLSKPEIQKH